MSRRSNEDGSLPFALLAAIIGAGIMTVLFSMVLTSEQAVRFDRDFTTAFHGAEAGLQAALVEIRVQEASGTPSSTVSGNGNTANVSYEYEAVKSGFRWQVKATGGADAGPPRHVEAEVMRDSRFTMAAFGKTLVGFKGGNGAGSYNGTSVETRRGTVGTNGEIHLGGSLAYNPDGSCVRSNTCVDEITLFGPDAKCAKTSSNCSLLESQDRVAGEPQPHKADTDFIEEALAAAWCVDSLKPYRSSDGPLVGGAGPGPDGEYCFSSMVFDHGRSTNLPVTGGEAIVYVAGTVSSINDSIVNCAGCESLSNTPSNSEITTMLAATPPDARLLQIYTVGTDVMLGNHTHLGAAIYAPNASCHGNPANAQGYIYGSMLCNDINNQGGWSFWYDERLDEIAGSTWRLSGLREEMGGTTSF